MFSISIFGIGGADAATIEISIPSGSSSPGCEVTEECFIPRQVSLNVGDVIIWENNDAAAHTVTSTDSNNVPNGIFDSGLFGGGNTFSHNFDSQGVFNYVCLVHPWMQGTIIVGTENEASGYIRTSKQSYVHGETIVISGKVSEKLERTPIIIQIFHGDNLADVAQVEVEQDGTFTHLVVAESVHFRNNGKYDVRGTYGVSTNLYETSFTIETDNSSQSTITDIFEVNIPTYGRMDVPYTIVGGTVKNMFTDIHDDRQTLLVMISTNADGALTLDLGRQWINSINNDGTDDDFIVTIDGRQVPYEAVKTDALSRIIRIYFLDGDSDISVAGTSGTNVGQNSNLPSNNRISIPSGSASPGCETGNRCYIPAQISIPRNSEVTWVNDDTAAHTVTSGNIKEGGPDGKFDSGLFMSGATFSHNFDTDGVFPYFCLVHPWMIGKVIVGTGIVTPTTPLVIKTDKSTYEFGDTIIITGTGGGKTQTALITISNSNNARVAELVVATTDTGNFQPIWAIPANIASGNYKITAKIGSQIAETTFFYAGATNDGELPTRAQISIPSGSSSPGCETTNRCYIPHAVSIEDGGEVVWVNDDTAAHTITSGNIKSGGPDGKFDSGLFMAGQTFSHRFTEQGIFPYFCLVHPWMEGIILVGEGNHIPPSPEPTPVSINISADRSSYDIGNNVRISITTQGIQDAHDVGITITNPSGAVVISRSVTIQGGFASLEFKIPEDFGSGNYRIDATASVNGQTYKQSTYFKIVSQFNEVRIVSVDSTDQQGNPSPLKRGEMGFVKVIVSAEKIMSGLVTVNLFDSELTSIGIGSVKNTFSAGQSEIIISFMIPSNAAGNTSDIYVNVFSDWVSNGGVPLTGEASKQVQIN